LELIGFSYDLLNEIELEVVHQAKTREEQAL
jgi:hypothetical protein